MIGRKDVEAAWGLIRPHVRRTPVIELPAGSLGFGVRGALQGVLQLVDAAQAVTLGGAADEDVEEFLAQIAHARFLA
jgi:hypothetical protein